jgi:hypothetical protein
MTQLAGSKADWRSPAPVCIPFFDVYPKGAPAEELKSLPGLYPELKSGITTAFPH